jgi:signal transduction histidine kinase
MTTGPRESVGCHRVVNRKLNSLARLADFASSLEVTPSTGLSPRRVTMIRAGWLVVFVLTIGLFFASLPGQYDYLASFSDPRLDPANVRANLEANDISIGFYATYLLSIHVALVTAWIVVGATIFWRRSDDWFAVFASLSLITFAAFSMNADSTLSVGPSSSMWLPVHLLGFFGSVSIVFFFFLFPDGRFVPRWTRWMAALWVAYVFPYYFFPTSFLDTYSSSPTINFVTVATFACTIAASQFYRYRRVSGPVQRQQTKWVVFGTMAAMFGTVGFALPFYNSPTIVQYGSPYAFAVAAGVDGTLLLIPLSIGVAILRYRLWNIDIVVNRTLVYGILSASVVAMYALIVGSLGTLLQGVANGSFVVSLLAVGLIAVLFAPLRERLQRGVNRLMYGDRDDPYKVLSELGERLETTLEPDEVLPMIVKTVAGTLKLPYAAIEMKRGEGSFEVDADHGSPTGEETPLPLTYQGETVGRLVLAPRAPGEAFSPADRRLLDDLARQAEVAVQAVRLTSDLRRSRERLITAREEERRRLRRDLHDGLGPTLGGLALGLDAARSMFAREPAAEELLARLKEESQEAVSDVRRLVYGLRPPALDDLGLLGAIRQQAAKRGSLVQHPPGTAGMQTGEHGLVFSIEATEPLPPLPAAVEVACYRIAQETIINVARHAKADSCRVSLRVDDAKSNVRLEIEDDGVGIPKERRSGVGMSSMRERAEELGGTLVVEDAPQGGTRVLARLPLFVKGGE